jgi:hypothetical protein
MRKVLCLDASAPTPDRRAVLKLQGVPAEAQLPQRVVELTDTAFQRYTELAAPAALVQEISQADFAEIYPGEGNNDPEASLDSICSYAERLALFAVTLGAGVSDEIERLFAENDPALGTMLDAFASVAAEMLADRVARRWRSDADGASRGSPALPYSPGYCGWHITGQRLLFKTLRPEEIGITLTESCLMQPMKSVSGVLVSAAPEIHQRCVGTFGFCADCTSQTCQDRIRSLLADTSGGQ